MILMMKMKGEEEEERGDWPRKGYEAFTAHGSPCTPVYLRSFMHTLSFKHKQEHTHLLPLFILWGEQRVNQRV